MSRNILIIAPYRTVAPHFETELEIAQRHHDLGDRVTLVSCLGELPACDFNPAGDRDICRECRLRRLDGLRKLPAGTRHLPLSARAAPAVSIPPVARRSLASLSRWRVGNFDIGRACLSSLISLRRNPLPDLVLNARQLQALADGARHTWNATRALISRHQPDRVYIFNGRFAAMRAVLRACQSCRVDCYVHERGCDTGHFQIFRNHLPHDIPEMEKRMREFWNLAATDPQRDRDAQAWFLGRVARVERNWRSFVTGQNRGTLPANWNPDRHNIVVFTSSEDEFAAIGDCWRNPHWPDQQTALDWLAQQLRQRRPDAHLTIRIHPNLTGVNNVSTRALTSLSGCNITVIPADHQVDTYQLLRLSDTVATFGSSVGIESVFWGRPSVLLGPCFYQNFSGPFRAGSADHAVELLAQNLMPAVTHEALLYGYWQQRNGIAFEHFEATDLFTGRFRGEEIWPRPRKRITRLVTRPINSLRKRIPLPRHRAA